MGVVTCQNWVPIPPTKKTAISWREGGGCKFHFWVKLRFNALPALKRECKGFFFLTTNLLYFPALCNHFAQNSLRSSYSWVRFPAGALCSSCLLSAHIVSYLTRSRAALCASIYTHSVAHPIILTRLHCAYICPDHLWCFPITNKSKVGNKYLSLCIRTKIHHDILALYN